MTAALEIIETGEVITEMTEEEASSITTRISVKLDTMADNFESAMPLIREALTRRAFAALGYASPGAYIADRFGNALSRLGADMRREVVRELSAAGLSTRAIAPVVGVSQRQVVKDRGTSAGEYRVLTSVERRELPAVQQPSSQSTGPTVDGQEPDSKAAPAGPLPEPDAATVTGMDGKTYAAKSKAKAQPYRKPLPDAARSAGWDLRKATERIQRIVEDDRFRSNEQQVANALRSHLLWVAETVAAVLDQLP